MADTPPTEAPDDGAENGEGREQAQPQLRAIAQFIQDLSFEIPDGAEALRNSPEGANLKVNVDVDTEPKAQDIYQVSLKFEAQAGTEERVFYNLEMIYAGLFALKDVPQQLVQPALYVDCASLLFPFARRLISDLTRESGFAPLMLDPIDFASLFGQKVQQARAAQAAQQPGDGASG